MWSLTLRSWWQKAFVILVPQGKSTWTWRCEVCSDRGMKHYLWIKQRSRWSTGEFSSAVGFSLQSGRPLCEGSTGQFSCFQPLNEIELKLFHCSSGVISSSWYKPRNLKLSTFCASVQFMLNAWMSSLNFQGPGDSFLHVRWCSPPAVSNHFLI